jgi:indolepyruvate ferredoxin oxidoreductase
VSRRRARRPLRHRACGLWVGFKLITDVADSAGTVLVDPDRIAPIIPQVLFDGDVLTPRLRPNATGPMLIEAERRIVHGQHEIAHRYARANGLNRIAHEEKRARVGVAAVGKAHYDLRQALGDLRLHDAALEAAGVRILKVGMIYPIEPTILCDFARGLEEILVVEDKRPTLETALKELLYHECTRPRVFGKTDETGAPLLPSHGELSAGQIARVLAARLGGALPSLDLAERIPALKPTPDGPRLAPPRTA